VGVRKTAIKGLGGALCYQVRGRSRRGGGVGGKKGEGENIRGDSFLSQGHRGKDAQYWQTQCGERSLKTVKKKRGGNLEGRDDLENERGDIPILGRSSGSG